MAQFQSSSYIELKNILEQINGIANRWRTVPPEHIMQLIISKDMDSIRELSE